MKIMLHGATHSSNFGDFLFAKIFYDKLKKAGYDVLFYDAPKIGMSSFFKKYLNYDHKMTMKDIRKYDVLVYMSGGYFGERVGDAEENIIRFVRYIPVGLLSIKMKKKILIIGVGGAPISNKWLRGKFVKIANYANLVVFRDSTTTKYYKENGVKKNIITTTDTAMLLSREIVPDRNNVGVDLKKNKKYVFLHLSGDIATDKQIEGKVLPAIDSFLDDNPNWIVIVGQDNICKNDCTIDILKKLKTNNKVKYSYQDPMQLYNLLGSIDLILTPKLHVGIIGSSLKRSVISFPYHAKKTERFYRQIGYSERCTPIDELRTDLLLNDMKRYKNKPILVPEKMIELSESNITLLLNELEKEEDAK